MNNQTSPKFPSTSSGDDHKNVFTVKRKTKPKPTRKRAKRMKKKPLPSQAYIIGDHVSLKKQRQGVIKYIGRVKFGKGVWYGIELLHNAVGKHDGEVDGERYFQTPPNKAIFVLSSGILNKICSSILEIEASASINSDSSANSKQNQNSNSDEDSKQNVLIKQTHSTPISCNDMIAFPAAHSISINDIKPKTHIAKSNSHTYFKKLKNKNKNKNGTAAASNTRASTPEKILRSQLKSRSKSPQSKRTQSQRLKETPFKTMPKQKPNAETKANAKPKLESKTPIVSHVPIYIPPPPKPLSIDELDMNKSRESIEAKIAAIEKPEPKPKRNSFKHTRKRSRSNLKLRKNFSKRERRKAYDKVHAKRPSYSNDDGNVGKSTRKPTPFAKAHSAKPKTTRTTRTTRNRYITATAPNIILPMNIEPNDEGEQDFMSKLKHKISMTPHLDYNRGRTHTVALSYGTTEQKKAKPDSEPSFNASRSIPSSNSNLANSFRRQAEKPKKRRHVHSRIPQKRPPAPPRAPPRAVTRIPNRSIAFHSSTVNRTTTQSTTTNLPSSFQYFQQRKNRHRSMTIAPNSAEEKALKQETDAFFYNEEDDNNDDDDDDPTQSIRNSFTESRDDSCLNLNEAHFNKPVESDNSDLIAEIISPHSPLKITEWSSDSDTNSDLDEDDIDYPIKFDGFEFNSDNRNGKFKKKKKNVKRAQSSFVQSIDSPIDDDFKQKIDFIHSLPNRAKLKKADHSKSTDIRRRPRFLSRKPTQPHKTTDDSQIQTESKSKSKFWKLFAKADKTNDKKKVEKEHEPKFIFGKHPSLLLSTKLARYAYSIPDVLIMLKQQLFKYDRHLSEGIFRVAPSATKNKEVKKQIDTVPNGYLQMDWQQVDGAIIANLIKVFYRELPQPVLQNVSTNLIKNCVSVKKAEDILNLNYGHVKEPDHSMFLWLLDLCLEVATHAEVNLMTTKNMAVVFAPNVYDTRVVKDPMLAMMMSQALAKMMEHAIQWRKESNEKHNNLQRDSEGID